MLGAIAGDIIGAPFEFAPYKHKDFPLFSEHSQFTDDTVLTVAIADILLHELDIVDTLKEYSKKYPGRGYGGSFQQWFESESRDPYNSWGNGSAMRTSSIGFFYNNSKSVVSGWESDLSLQIQEPQLKWKNGGSFSSWCETGWYSSPAVADLDGDGSMEVIGASYSIFILDGSSGDFIRQIEPGWGRQWPSLVIADLEGDGDLASFWNPFSCSNLSTKIEGLLFTIN